MPNLNADAFRRTKEAVLYTEALRRNRDTTAPGLVENSRPLIWVLLNGDVYGTTTATGTPENWSISGDAYAADSGHTPTVRDATRRNYGLENQWVLCRPSRQTAAPHGILEIVWCRIPASSSCTAT